jgi:xanthosine phosphorylase
MHDLSPALHIIQQKLPDFKPKVGIVLGSGLGSLSEQLTDKQCFSYEELPGFPISTVAGHAGKLHLGKLSNVPVACLQGRVHPYEGTSAQGVKTLIRTLKLLGCEVLLITNAAGSLRADVGPGHLLMITDHINFQINNPLVGPNDEEFGSRFVAMTDAYDLNLREQLAFVAMQEKIDLAQGVYISTLGPCFETAAEIRAFKLLGADAVGMSTVPEVIVARHCGLRVAVISVITNLAAGMSDEKISHENTLHFAALGAGNLQRLIMAFLAKSALD